MRSAEKKSRKSNRKKVGEPEHGGFSLDSSWNPGLLQLSFLAFHSIYWPGSSLALVFGARRLTLFLAAHLQPGTFFACYMNMQNVAFYTLPNKKPLLACSATSAREAGENPRCSMFGRVSHPGGFWVKWRVMDVGLLSGLTGSLLVVISAAKSMFNYVRPLHAWSHRYL